MLRRLWLRFVDAFLAYCARHAFDRAARFEALCDCDWHRSRVRYWRDYAADVNAYRAQFGFERVLPGSR